MCYAPSVLATATMLHVIKEIEPCDYMEHQNQLMGVLKISEVDVISLTMSSAFINPIHT